MQLSPSRASVAFRPRLAVVLGTNEIASAVAVHLRRAGRGVVLAHDPLPPVLRRGMAFHDALWGDETVLDGIGAVAAEGLLAVLEASAAPERVAVTRLGLIDLMPLGRFDLLVDARLQKYAVTPDLRPFAIASIGLGPGFTADLDCDVAIETRPGRAGLLVTHGSTEAPDGSPPPLGGHGEDRFVRASDAGVWRTAFPVGARVFRGQPIGRLDRTTVAAPLDGILRGLVRDDTEVPAGAKLIEIDPRGRWRVAWTGIDERGRAIAEAVVGAADRLDRSARDHALSLTTPFPNRSPR